MIIDVLCPNQEHPVNAWLENWVTIQNNENDVALLSDISQLRGGKILFLVSCNQVVGSKIRSKYEHVMVLHASALPIGRGWSPHIWAIIDGAAKITVTLLVAEDKVDTGAIWAHRLVNISQSALYDEINSAIFSAETELMTEGVGMVIAGKIPVPQEDTEATYYRQRTPADSMLDPEKSLISLFTQMRVADPDRYPAYFQLHGETYTISIKKKKSDA